VVVAGCLVQRKTGTWEVANEKGKRERENGRFAPLEMLQCNSEK